MKRVGKYGVLYFRRASKCCRLQNLVGTWGHWRYGDADIGWLQQCPKTSRKRQVASKQEKWLLGVAVQYKAWGNVCENKSVDWESPPQATENELIERSLRILWLRDCGDLSFIWFWETTQNLAQVSGQHHLVHNEAVLHAIVVSREEEAAEKQSLLVRK